MLQLKKFADIPVSTREKDRESRPHPEEPRFRLLAREEGSFPCVVGRRIPGVPFASQEQALCTGKARGTPGSCYHSQCPPDVSVHSRETCFPCTASTFKPRIDSHHGVTRSEEHTSELQSPCELLGCLSGFPSRRCRGLRPWVESVPEPEYSSPMQTWILGYF